MIGSFLNNKGANSFTEMNAATGTRNSTKFLGSSSKSPKALSILILIMTHSVEVNLYIQLGSMDCNDYTLWNLFIHLFIEIYWIPL